jgi:hypothetical protein
VALEQFAQNCYGIKGRRSSKPSPKHPFKLHVLEAISRQGPGPYFIFDGKVELFAKQKIHTILLPSPHGLQCIPQ